MANKISPIDERPSSNRLACLFWPLAAICALLLTIAGFQFTALAKYYDLCLITGGEGYTTYGIWKVQHGYPLYEWPNKDYFQLTLYNWLFYTSYAKILSAISVRDVGILLFGRLLTASAAVCGAFIQYFFLKRLLPEYRGVLFKGILICSCIFTWFNTIFPGYFFLSIRSDVPEAMLALAALFLYAGHLRCPDWRMLCGSVLLLFAAWSFKQSGVEIFLGIFIYALLGRRWIDLFILSGVFVAGAALTLLIWGPAYRYNILVAPTVNRISPLEGLTRLAPGVLCTLFVWVGLAPGLIGSFHSARNLWKGKPEAELSGRERIDLLLCSVVVFGGAFGFLTLSKTGSSLNHLLEMFTVAVTLATATIIRFAGEQPRKRIRLGLICLCIAGGLLAPLAQLSKFRIGPITRFTAATAMQKRETYEFIQSLPSPTFLRDELLCLPWISTGNRHPSITIDPVFFSAAQEKGLIEKGGIGGLVGGHFFGSLLLSEKDELIEAALAAGYVEKPVPAAYRNLPDSMGREPVAVRLFVRQQSER